MNILTALSLVAVLGGCGAILTVPFTTPVWFILALLMPGLPRLHRLWSGWTWLMLVQFGLIAGLAVLILFSPNPYSPWQTPTAQFLWRAMIFMPGLIWLSWRLARSASATPGRRWLSAGLQFVTMAVATIFTITIFRPR